MFQKEKKRVILSLLTQVCCQMMCQKQHNFYIICKQASLLLTSDQRHTILKMEIIANSSCNLPLNSKYLQQHKQQQQQQQSKKKNKDKNDPSYLLMTPSHVVTSTGVSQLRDTAKLESKQVKTWITLKRSKSLIVFPSDNATPWTVKISTNSLDCFYFSLFNHQVYCKLAPKGES